MKKLTKGLIYLYKKIDPYCRIIKHIDRTIDICGIRLRGNILDDGFTAYERMSAEVSNPFYDILHDEFMPDLVFDVGANYGFISAIIRKQIPTVSIVAIEPNKNITPYLRQNVEPSMVYESLCGNRYVEERSFYINPLGSQDCRVRSMKGWRRMRSSMVTLDLIYYESLNVIFKNVFIKTDTQGYEEYVIQGARKLLAETNWLMKMEFAPAWLEVHGTDPLKFLEMLTNKYDVAELPTIVPYHTTGIDDLFRNRILDGEQDFVDFVENKKPSRAGWVDLLIRPKSK